MSSYERDLESLRDQLTHIVITYEQKKSVKNLIAAAKQMLQDLNMLPYDNKED